MEKSSNSSRLAVTTAFSLLLILVSSTLLPLAANAQQAPIFTFTMLVPVPNPARQSWSLVVQNNLESMGIDVGRVILDFTTLATRTFNPAPSVAGKTYNDGGYDLLFVGYGLTIDADPWSLYHTSQFAPGGGNFYYWNNTQNDQLTVQIKETVEKTARLNLLKQWQVLAADELPSIPIFYTKEIVAHGSTISNGEAIFYAYHFPAWPPIEHLSMEGTADTLIMAQTGPAPDQGLIPILTNSYYDGTASTPIYNGLAVRNDSIFKSMVPALADGTVAAPGWSVASDQKTWTVNLRPGTRWHDYLTCIPQPACGQVTAADVKFTFDAVQNVNGSLPSPVSSFVRGIVGGENNVTIVDSDTVRFDLPAPYAYFIENILSLSILPQHILGSIPYRDWKTSPFNTGTGCSPTTPCPVGTGPYKFADFDAITKTVRLLRNDDYFDFPDKGKAALIAKGQFEVREYFVTEIAGSDAAITAFQGGQANVLDSQYHLESVPSFLSDIGAGRWVDYDAFGVQEISINMKHPILGTGVDTPLGRSTPSRAAEAAKYVRQAISYAVPRDLIIEQLLNGYGNPAITTPVVGNYRTDFAVTEGFNTDVQPFAFDMAKAREMLQKAGYAPLGIVLPTFWEIYGLYIAGALIAGIVALAALYFFKLRKPRMPPAPMTSMSTSP